MTPITQEIAKRVVDTRYQQISRDVAEYGKTLAMSALGAMVAGSTCVGSDIVARYALDKMAEALGYHGEYVE